MVTLKLLHVGHLFNRSKQSENYFIYVEKEQKVQTRCGIISLFMASKFEEQRIDVNSEYPSEGGYLAPNQVQVRQCQVYPKYICASFSCPPRSYICRQIR
jgi:hypothetical protein